MQIFRVKNPSCKILKTKNCVPFEVQYTSSENIAFLQIYIILKQYFSVFHYFVYNKCMTTRFIAHSWELANAMTSVTIMQVFHFEIKPHGKHTGMAK